MRLRRMSLKALAAGKPMGDERGIALVMALGILVVCAIMVTTVIAYTSSGQRTSYFSKARLTAFDRKRLQKLDISNKAQADDIKTMLEGATFKAVSVEAKPTKRNPGRGPNTGFLICG